MSFYDTTHKSKIHLTTILQFLNLKLYLFTAHRRLLTKLNQIPSLCLFMNCFMVIRGNLAQPTHLHLHMFLDNSRRLENLGGNTRIKRYHLSLVPATFYSGLKSLWLHYNLSSIITHSHLNPDPNPVSSFCAP